MPAPSTSIRIHAGIIETMVSHVTAAYPLEGCGVLIGCDDDSDSIELTRAIATRNAEPARAANHFLIDPLELLKIETELSDSQNGTRIVGFFHSHPDAPALPSSMDLEPAQAVFDFARYFYVYGIVSVMGGRPRDITFWRLSSELDKFIELKASSTAKP